MSRSSICAAIFAALAALVMGDGLIAQESRAQQDEAAVKAAVARVLSLLPADTTALLDTEKVDAKSELAKYQAATEQFNLLDIPALREVLLNVANTTAILHLATPKVTFWENVGLQGREGFRTRDDGNIRNRGDLQGVAISSLATVGTAWFWFWPDEGFRGSLLAVESPQIIRDLRSVTKINSCPLAACNGNWNDEIQGVSILGAPPQCGGITTQPGRQGVPVDGITIVRANGHIETCR